LIFQTLDAKKECVGVYLDGNITYDLDSLDFNKLETTWNYSSFLENKDVEYASLFCDGLTLHEACPDEFKDRWELIVDRLKAFLVSFGEAKLNLNEVCFFDLVPERFLKEYCDVKTLITKDVLDKCEKPNNYDFLVDLTKLVSSVESQPLNIDLSCVTNQLTSYKAREFVKKIKSKTQYIKYNVFGTVTGRLTTKKTSFPILTFPKDMRSILKPNNDFFVELDFNAAELRTLLALAGVDQPEIDIDEWNAKNVYNGQVSREEAKKKIFAWLYNPESKDKLASQKYNRDSVVQKYFDGSQVNTFFGRKIPTDYHRALNYIIQSTTSDLFLRRALKIHDMLSGKKSYISYMIHDSLVIDFSLEDKADLLEIINTFSDTGLGKFKANVSIGDNFGEMQQKYFQESKWRQ